MSDSTYIVVFPSLFAESKISLLMANIKKILKIQNQNFTKVFRDGNLILVEANDPVFASSTIGLLFGIKEIVIAKQIKNDFKTIVSEITKVGSSLLLKGEKFYVSVNGNPHGYMTKDVELSATSSLIEKNKRINAKPGTKEKHDKLLMAYITKSNAYVSIFNDKGLGGTVNNSQNEKIICGISDEFSGITCLETIKQGFDVKIVVFYKDDSELMNIVKILHKILPRTLQLTSQIAFYKLDSGKIVPFMTHESPHYWDNYVFLTKFIFPSTFETLLSLNVYISSSLQAIHQSAYKSTIVKFFEFFIIF